MRHGGLILIHQLKILGCKHVFCVPGESFLAVLDGLYEVGQIQTVTCRHEGGAAMMAQAHGRLTGTPGICFVTRGPGAMNAAIGLHIAQQDSTPMVLFIGLPKRSERDRETFQEFDPKAVFGTIAKDVSIIDEAARIPEYLSRAFHIALSGRPGPVVLGLPEDMLRDRVHTADCGPVRPAHAAPSLADMTEFADILNSTNRPLMIVGGPGWSQTISEKVCQFAEKFDLPVATAFRCQDYIDNRHEHYIGDAGIGINPKLAEHIKRADLLIAFGPRLGEMTTSGYTLVQPLNPEQRLIHIYPDGNEIGRVYRPRLGIVSQASHFADALEKLKTPKTIHWHGWREKARKDYLNFKKPVDTPGDVKLEYIITLLNEILPEDAIICNGAGNYTAWLHRYFDYKRFGTQAAPRAGAMGYSLPAAISAKLNFPDRVVVSLAGDGCFMMSANELATAAHFGLSVINIVVNNRMLGTIRMHQEKQYPNRVIGTTLTNPDFVKLAESFGAYAELVEHRKTFRTSLKQAMRHKGPSLIELRMDENALTPSMTLAEVREKNK